MSCSLFSPPEQTMTREQFQCAMTTNFSAPTFAASKCSVSRRLLSAVVVSVVLLSWTSPAHAANRTWTNAVTGSWTDGTKWTGGVPVATDSATFNQTGAYTVNFSNVFQDLNDMIFSAGTVTFERLVSPATLTVLNASGRRDLTI